MSRLIWCIPVLALLSASWGCAALGEGRPPEMILAVGEDPGPQDLLVTFFEVGLGDATLIEFPGGGTLLVDAGIGWRVQGILDYLEARGIERLDGLLLTHPHLDHYGGMERIVEGIPVGTFYHNGVPSSSGAYSRLLAALEIRGTPVRVLRRGDLLAEISGPCARLEVLLPDAPAIERKGDPNQGSIVLRLGHGPHRFLFLGDLERGDEERLVELEGEGLRATVVKLGHHASPGTGGEGFLRSLCPRVAIALGTEVRDVPLFYPHPNYRIRRVLRREGALLLTTGEEGAIQVISGSRGELRLRSLEGGCLLLSRR